MKLLLITDVRLQEINALKECCFAGECRTW